MKKILLEQLLLEFNKGDREEIMRHANDFGVSYEIELISEVAVCDADGEYGDSDEREERRIDRARRYLNEEYFYENAADRSSDDFFASYNSHTDIDIPNNWSCHVCRVWCADRFTPR